MDNSKNCLCCYKKSKVNRLTFAFSYKENYNKNFVDDFFK